MDTYRALLAVVISFVILVGYQFFFVGFGAKKAVNEPAPTTSVTSVTTPAATNQTSQLTSPTQEALKQPLASPVQPARPAREINIDTDLYSAVITENGGAIKSFILKDYKESRAKDSAGVQLVKTTEQEGFPLTFSWGGMVATNTFYGTDTDKVEFAGTETTAALSMKGLSESGLELERTYHFNRNTYLLELVVRVKNVSASPLQGSALLHQVNLPFEEAGKGSMTSLFSGPALFMDGQRLEFKSKDLTAAPKTIQGNVDWAAYDSTYFMCGILPENKGGTSVTMQQTDKLVTMQVGAVPDVLQSGEEKVYKYHVYFGPKKLSLLEKTGYNLDKAVNFGWFDVMAKPTLWLLNFFHTYFKNYGIAIILVTVAFKLAFWPIAQKGLKSMKNMQKLQPKMVKLKEKYKDDPAMMNKEVMNLYKTYKVNPLGGCLPMVLQIPVFFALYKVLLMCIELRHAPFMLWITDLSAPDRLMIGIDIPYLGGLPILTLLMGASMFLQQKMTPTTADPTQAKIMMFLPVMFTFMFLNFASGLVLYWFVNNMLAILQQYLINRQANKTLAV
ncbi:MAG: membrane protein insertase YidC [Proteobacteria bacterium]|nr:membrane protein insertase YidC [Pseudomonadota bacterium]MBU1649609.1 membrane protein insertase YidC [Pseudomonadota bacterium]MBU1986955.1 membrane protein insertase YidC [Pseudomonadota bacterium]